MKCWVQTKITAKDAITLLDHLGWQKGSTNNAKMIQIFKSFGMSLNYNHLKYKHLRFLFRGEAYVFFNVHYKK